MVNLINDPLLDPNFLELKTKVIENSNLEKLPRKSSQIFVTVLLQKLKFGRKSKFENLCCLSKIEILINNWQSKLLFKTLGF